MKDLKLWQKMGLVAAIVTGLTLGGITPKYSSKGLESKIPTVGMSVAEAKEVYQSPTELDKNRIEFDGEIYSLDRAGYIDVDKNGTKETYGEIFKNSKRQCILKWTTNGRTWAWSILLNPFNEKDTINNYSIRDSDCNGDFDERYAGNEPLELPNCL